MNFSVWRIIWLVVLPMLLMVGCKVPLDERQAVVELQKKVAMLEEELELSANSQQRLKQELEALQLRFAEARDLILKQGEELQVLADTQVALKKQFSAKVKPEGQKISQAAAVPLTPFSEAEEQVLERLYNDSMTAYQNGDYENAVKLFAAYLRDFPDTAKSANARYWLGESYYSMAQYAQAITEFKRVRKDFPASAKDSDSLLKTAMSYEAIGGREPARAAYTELLRRYPVGLSAERAEKALDRLE